MRGLRSRQPAQRAHGAVRAEFCARRRAHRGAAAPSRPADCRLRFPAFRRRNARRSILNTGGGMAGGDRRGSKCRSAPAARAIVDHAGGGKNLSRRRAPTDVAVSLGVAAGASLVWAPQETLLFDGADLRRRLEADVAADASLLIVESAVFGRLAHGETRIDAAFRDDWRIRRAGKLIFAEAVRLENAGADARPARVRRAARAPSRPCCGSRPRRRPARRSARAVRGARWRPKGARLEAGASALDGFADRAPAFAGAAPAARRARRRDAPAARPRGAAGLDLNGDGRHVRAVARSPPRFSSALPARPPCSR